MKKLICMMTAVLLGLSGMPASAQMKAVDKSAKKVPTWVSGAETNYIITSAIKSDLETAKKQALEDVREQMIRAVAENVKASSTGTISQEISGDEIVSFLDTFSSKYETQAAKLPFMKGVSASKIEEYYWEHRQDKKAGTSEYLYAIKYPFPSVELKQMVREFEKYDKEMSDKYNVLEAGLNQVETVEELDRAIVSLNPLIEYFFDDTRKGAAKGLQGAYKKMYDNITFWPVENKLGEYTFYLVLDGRPITTSQRAAVKSDIATELAFLPQPDRSYKVTYGYDLAEYGVENPITVNFRFGGKSVPHKFFFTVKKHQVNLWPEKTVYLTAKQKGDSEIGQIEVRMNIQNGYQSGIRIRNLTLNVPGLAQPLFFDNLEAPIQGGKKDNTLQVTWDGTVGVLRPQNNKQGIVRGYMEIAVYDQHGDLMQERLDFSLPFQPNW